MQTLNIVKLNKHPVAGVFAQSVTTGAPVDWCKAILEHQEARA